MSELIVIAAMAIYSVTCGWASRYDEVPTDATLEYRIETNEVSAGFDTYIARPLCSELGAIYWIDYGEGWHLAQVFDCAVQNDSDGALSWMQNNNILVELDWHSAERIGFTHLGSVPVCLMPVNEPPYQLEGELPY